MITADPLSQILQILRMLQELDATQLSQVRDTAHLRQEDLKRQASANGETSRKVGGAGEARATDNDDERPLVHCESGPHGPRIFINFDGEERSISVARALRVRDGLAVAIAQGLAEIRRQVEERKP